MKFEFSEKIPNEFKGNVILLSGEETRTMDKSVYLTIENDLNCYEIRYPFICSPFKKVIKIGSILAVGYQSFFYLFNIVLNNNLLNFEIRGYFSDIYVDQNLLYVTGAMGLYCFSLDGILVWESIWFLRNNNMVMKSLRLLMPFVTCLIAEEFEASGVIAL